MAMVNLQVMIDDSGKLVRNTSEVPPLREAYRSKERLRDFGELVWTARKVCMADGQFCNGRCFALWTACFICKKTYP